jgi:hypothetical protein
MKIDMIVMVDGKRESYVFRFKGDPASLEEWRADGLKVYVLERSIPAWVVDLGLTSLWCRLQDVWKTIRL